MAQVGSDAESDATASSTEDESGESAGWYTDEGRFMLNAASPFGATEAQLEHIRHLLEVILKADHECTFKEMRLMVNEQMGSAYEGKAWRKWFQSEGTIIMDRIDGHDAESASEDDDSIGDNSGESKNSRHEIETKNNSAVDDIDAKTDTDVTESDNTTNGHIITDAENTTGDAETSDAKRSELTDEDTKIAQHTQEKNAFHLTAASPSSVPDEQLDHVRAIMHDLLSDGQVTRDITCTICYVMRDITCTICYVMRDITCTICYVMRDITCTICYVMRDITCTICYVMREITCTICYVMRDITCTICYVMRDITCTICYGYATVHFSSRRSPTNIYIPYTCCDDQEYTFKEVRMMVNDRLGSDYDGKEWRKWFQAEGIAIMDKIDHHTPLSDAFEEAVAQVITTRTFSF